MSLIAIFLLAEYQVIYSLILLFLLSYFILLADIDVRFYLLPNSLTLPLLLFGLITAYCNINTLSLQQSLIGSVVGYLLLWLPAKAYSLIRHKTGLGGGDIKLIAALGSWIDDWRLPSLLLIASLLGLLYWAIRFLYQHNKQHIIPFGPCLLMSGYLTLLQQFSLT